MTLAEQIAEMVAQAITKAIQDLEPDLTNIAEAGGHAAQHDPLGDVADIVQIITNLAGPIGSIAGLFFEPIKLLEDAGGAGGKLGHGFGAGYFLGYAAWQLLAPAVLPLQHGIANLAQTEIFDPQTAARLDALGLLPHQDGRSEAAGGNLSGEHYDRLVEAARLRPDPTTLLTMLRRKMTDQATVDATLGLHGYERYWRDRFLQLERVLLSPADLALAELRGELVPGFAASYAQTLGVDAEDFDILIANTGEPPGVMELLFAYRRGFVDKPRLEKGIRQSRVRNEWIDVIEKLRYSPMSTADAINAHVQGHITEAVSRAKTQENGLEPEDWQALFETAGTPLSREEMLSLWHRGLATEEDVKQAVRESHTKDKYVQWAVDLGRRLIPYRTINTILSHGVRDKQWGIDYLVSLGYTHDDADALVATSTSTRTSAAKQLTETQILALYETRGIPHDQAVGLLKTIGYDEHETGFILDAHLAKAALAEQTKAIAATRTQFLHHRVTLNEARGELDKIGVLADYRDQLLKDWQIEIKGQVLDLTPAQLGQAAALGIITFDQAVNRLVQLGYSENDAKISVAIHLKGLPAGVTITGI